jgi:hypothetical protein
MLDWLYDAMVWMYESLVSLLTWLVFYFIYTLTAIASPLLQGIASLLPTGFKDSMSDVLSALAPYYAFINYYFPLNEAFVLIGIVITFWVGFVSVKLVLKCVPTIG